MAILTRAVLGVCVDKYFFEGQYDVERGDRVSVSMRKMNATNDLKAKHDDRL
ncbi:MAG TPA: hypothetical protein VK776_03210 [Bryobacteraceae bacterium]|nr:hypothetical protein [Bryobacteraceae bacterium]